MRTSNEATVTIPAAPTPTPTPTPEPHSGAGGAHPYDLIVWVDNAGGLNLDWEAPTLATGRVLTEYVIQYRKASEAEADAVTLTLDTSTYSALQTGRRLPPQVTREDEEGNEVTTGLIEEDQQYRARVRATHTASDGTGTTNTNWTWWHPAVTASREPISAWFIDDTPNYNQNIGRTFMMVDTSHANASAVCIINDSQRINCPPRTLVSLDVHDPGGKYNVRTEAYAGEHSVTLNPFKGRMKSAPPPPIRVSGGNGKLYVGWHVPHTLRGGGCHRYSGFLEGFTVQYRKQNSDDSWPEWSDANAVTEEGRPGRSVSCRVLRWR